MEQQYPFTTTQAQRDERRAQRAAARKKRERERRRRLLARLIPAVAVAAVALTAALRTFSGGGEAQASAPQAPEEPPVQTQSLPPEPEVEVEAEPYSLSPTAATAQIGEELASEFAIVIDLDGGAILAQKNAEVLISPASMTKILTILVAAEHVENLSDTVVIDFDITDYCYRNDCSVAGFFRDEAVTVEDLFYGTILPSGAEAALGLAKYVAGSQEAFVELMNEKAEELGLADTAHFTNCVGLYDKAHVCTAYDMAMILKAAMENDLCREVLSTKVHEIPASETHPEGMVLSNWFLRKIEDHVPEAFQVVGAKTGFVAQSGNCAASWAQDAGGNSYLCVTGNAFSSWRCIKDHIQLYTEYIPRGN